METIVSKGKGRELSSSSHMSDLHKNTDLTQQRYQFSFPPHHSQHDEPLPQPPQGSETIYLLSPVTDGNNSPPLTGIRLRVCFLSRSNSFPWAFSLPRAPHKAKKHNLSAEPKLLSSAIPNFTGHCQHSTQHKPPSHFHHFCVFHWCLCAVLLRAHTWDPSKAFARGVWEQSQLGGSVKVQLSCLEQSPAPACSLHPRASHRMRLAWSPKAHLCSVVIHPILLPTFPWSPQ